MAGLRDAAKKHKDPFLSSMTMLNKKKKRKVVEQARDNDGDVVGDMTQVHKSVMKDRADKSVKSERGAKHADAYKSKDVMKIKKSNLALKYTKTSKLHAGLIDSTSQGQLGTDMGDMDMRSVLRHTDNGDYQVAEKTKKKKKITALEVEDSPGMQGPTKRKRGMSEQATKHQTDLMQKRMLAADQQQKATATKQKTKKKLMLQGTAQSDGKPARSEPVEEGNQVENDLITARAPGVKPFLALLPDLHRTVETVKIISSSGTAEPQTKLLKKKKKKKKKKTLQVLSAAEQHEEQTEACSNKEGHAAGKQVRSVHQGPHSGEVSKVHVVEKKKKKKLKARLSGASIDMLASGVDTKVSGKARTGSDTGKEGKLKVHSSTGPNKKELQVGASPTPAAVAVPVAHQQLGSDAPTRKKKQKKKDETPQPAIQIDSLSTRTQSVKPAKHAEHAESRSTHAPTHPTINGPELPPAKRRKASTPARITGVQQTESVAAVSKPDSRAAGDAPAAQQTAPLPSMLSPAPPKHASEQAIHTSLQALKKSKQKAASKHPTSHLDASHAATLSPPPQSAAGQALHLPKSPTQAPPVPNSRTTPLKGMLEYSKPPHHPSRQVEGPAGSGGPQTACKSGTRGRQRPTGATSEDGFTGQYPSWFKSGGDVLVQLQAGSPGVVLDGSARISVVQGEVEVMGHVMTAESEDLEVTVGGRDGTGLLLQPTVFRPGDDIISKDIVVVAVSNFTPTAGADAAAASFGAGRSQEGDWEADKDTGTGARASFQLYVQGEPTAPAHVQVNQEWRDALSHVKNACLRYTAQQAQGVTSPDTALLPPPIIAVVGPKGAGKSTFTRLLVNTLLTAAKEVAYFDTDCGQPEFTPPGLVSLNRVVRPVVGPPWLHPLQPVGARFIGDLSPSGHPALFLRSVQSLTEQWAGYDTLLAAHTAIFDKSNPGPGLGSLPLVVNTCGWVSGMGLHVLTDLLRLMAVTHIVELRGRGAAAKKNLPGGNFWSCMGFEGVDILAVHAVDSNDSSLLTLAGGSPTAGPSPSDTAGNDVGVAEDESGEAGNAGKKASRSLSALQCRSLQMLSFAKGCVGMDPREGTCDGEDFTRVAAALCSHPPYCISMDDITVASPLSSLPRGHEARILNGTIVGLCCSGCPATVEKLKGSCRIFDAQLQCFGLGLVRLADERTRQLYLLTGVDEALLERVDVLMVGKLSLPMALLQTPAMLSPYHTLSCLQAGAAGGGAIYSRRNLPRIAQMQK